MTLGSGIAIAGIWASYAYLGGYEGGERERVAILMLGVVFAVFMTIFDKRSR